MSEFKPTGYGNEAVRGDGFYISYNPNPRDGAYAIGLGPLMDMTEMIVGASNEQEETALCKDDSALVLNGDFRQEYLAVLDAGYDACLVVYKDLERQYRSEWSEDR